VIVRTFDGLQALTTQEPRWATGGSSGSLALYDYRAAYAEIYRTQPNVRICVDFLSRNIAQLGLHVFRRISDTDRVRLADHELERWIGKANPSTRRYRLFENLMGDLGIYFEAYWVKVRYRDDRGRNAIGLVRLPPEEMTPVGGLLPSQFVWSVNGREKEFAPSEIVFFNGYNPCNPLRGLSPMETLRRILSEEAAAGEQRESYWRNANRMEGIIQQSKDAPNYKGQQLAAFREQLAEFKSRGAKAGEMAVLPLGMEAKPWSFSAKDSEYIAGGKLRREVCAAEYHIQQPMVGILDHATFSNIRAQHQYTYQDSLAPWLEMITEEIEGQLLVECEDTENVYVEFNIADKLKGSFEEQVNSLHTATGRAFMTVNEARARMNLPRDEDPASDRIAPQQGGPSDASAQPAAPAAETVSGDETVDVSEEEAARAVQAVVQANRERQRARLARRPPDEHAEAFFADLERWNRELTADLTPWLGADEAAHLAVATNVATYMSLTPELV
jgi:HK97 family phage portal protein